MIKVIETFTPKTGETQVKEKTYSSWKVFRKMLDNSPLATPICYKLEKLGKATFKYGDGIAVIEVIRE